MPLVRLRSDVCAVAVWFFCWCFSTDFYSDISSVVKLSLAALVRVKDTDRK